jgi:hypothetical protein
MAIADDLEVALAKQTIVNAKLYMHWINRTGPYAPPKWWELLLLIPPRLRFPPMPIAPDAVRRAERILKKAA